MTISTYPPQHAAVPMKIAEGGTSATTAAQARTNLELGSMAQQNANAVAITGGRAGGLTSVGGAPALYVVDSPGDNVVALLGQVQASGGANRWFLMHQGDAPSSLGGTLQVTGNIGVRIAAQPTAQLYLLQNRGLSHHGIVIAAQGDDGNGLAVNFLNMAGSQIGYIYGSATTTTYATSSDVRLKTAIEKLVGSLDVIRVLNPVSFLWKANDNYGEGFRADELQQVIPQAVTGEPDALNEDGSIRPQGVDYGKLVPRLVGAIQELLVRVEALEARLV